MFPGTCVIFIVLVVVVVVVVPQQVPREGCISWLRMNVVHLLRFHNGKEIPSSGSKWVAAGGAEKAFTSVLTIASAKPEDSGRFTCQPYGAAPAGVWQMRRRLPVASVDVHIVKGRVEKEQSRPTKRPNRISALFPGKALAAISEGGGKTDSSSLGTNDASTTSLPAAVVPLFIIAGGSILFYFH